MKNHFSIDKKIEYVANLNKYIDDIRNLLLTNNSSCICVENIFLNLNAKINTLDNVANDKNIRDIMTYKDLVIAIFIPFEFWIITIEKTTIINQTLSGIFAAILFYITLKILEIPISKDNELKSVINETKNNFYLLMVNYYSMFPKN